MKHLSTLGQVSGFEVSSFSADQARRADVGATVYSAPDDIPGDTFGGVAAIHVVEHLDDVVADAAVATWSRILRAGGRALVVTPDPGGRARTLAGDTWNGFSDETHINLKPHGEWLAFFEERELKVIRHGSDGLWNVPYSGRPKLVDAMVYAVPALAQFLSGRLFLPPGSGESSIFVLEKS
jgi:SAM-dependent methyltransferase